MPSLASLLRGVTRACALTILLATPSLVAGQVATIGSIEPRAYALDATSVRVATSQSFNYAGSSFITVHFSRFELAAGDKVIVRSADGATQYEYAGLGRGELGLQGGFYSSRVPGDTAVVDFIPSDTTPVRGGFAVDKITRAAKSFGVLTTCGTDDTLPAKCYANETTMYHKSSAVARLLIDGVTSCTGWLVGSEGHLISNYHCLGEGTQALTTDYELNAESASCDEQCKTKSGCPGKIVASSAVLVAADADLDYALVKLNSTADLSAYGYMTLRVAGATAAERIYIPQHPGGYAKRIAAVDDDGSSTVIAGVDASSACGDHRVLYTADTAPGSSGSPVVATADHAVVALHSCGVLTEPCVNSGTDIRGIIFDLQSKGVVPRDALDDPAAPLPVGPWIPGITPPPTPPPTPAPTQSVCRIFIFQASCENTIPGRCLWVDGTCQGNPAYGATPAPTTVAPPAPEPTTPPPTTPTPTTPALTTPTPTTATREAKFSVCRLLWFKSTCELLGHRACAWASGACVAVASG